MSKKTLANEYLSDFCAGLALLVHAGITIGDGVATLALDYNSRDKFLAGLQADLEAGENLTDALTNTGVVPDYMLDMIRLGERSGRLEQTLLALANYYNSKANLALAIRNALLYPAVLIIMLAAVVIVLITKVLPIFADVFSQMGATLPAFSQSLIRFGQKLSSASAVLIWIMAGIVLICLIIAVVIPLRHRVSAFFRYHFGATGVFKDTLTARFSSAMTTAISSGLDSGEAVVLAGNIVRGVRKTDKGIKACQVLLGEGASLEKSLGASGVFSSREIRLISLGVRAGTTDSVMADISRRSNEKAVESIESALGKIEPSLVVIISLVVCAVLLSVMLPLMGIMSAIG